jgi:hypothetical protein
MPTSEFEVLCEEKKGAGYSVFALAAVPGMFQCAAAGWQNSC